MISQMWANWAECSRVFAVNAVWKISAFQTFSAPRRIEPCARAQGSKYKADNCEDVEWRLCMSPQTALRRSPAEGGCGRESSSLFSFAWRLQSEWCGS